MKSEAGRKKSEDNEPRRIGDILDEMNIDLLREEVSGYAPFYSGRADEKKKEVSPVTII